MKDEKYIELITLPGMVKLDEIPVLDYGGFSELVLGLLSLESNHCLNYFVVPFPGKYKFICCIGCDERKSVRVFSHEQERNEKLILPSLSCNHFPLHIFEREIHENFGIDFSGHPWLKPVRYPIDRHDKNRIMDNYPFYTIGGEELHEVGVGPIHAGVIEPGHFRFICNGEKVLHLEIQLGYQHRGVENLFVQNEHGVKKAVLAESIAGDTATGHAVCHAALMETLGSMAVSGTLSLERTIALELERIAVHIGDTAALCTDIAYQFGQVVCEALRTVVINTTQSWCGNRFGKGLIRAGGTHYPLTPEIAGAIRKNLEEVRERYNQITGRIFSMSSVLSRFEGTGKVTRYQASLIGAVGMAARSSGLKRDIRWSHPSPAYGQLNYDPVVINRGDVWARAKIRVLEVEKSMEMVFQFLDLLDGKSENTLPVYKSDLMPDAFAIALTEGWRGEICHCAVTDEKGKIIHYKVKDPSLHNWMALAIAVRGQEISDFPLCNKSYNLSYCGNDL
ncbi:MAG: NADH-quinone oxidoreductase subunit C [Bacteroidetes bacterium]|nr:NADH-quinone oxidoreductase subunit C [Bacteroidota bacterium]